MKTIPGLRGQAYLRRIGIVLIAIALVAAVVSCNGGADAYELAMEANPAAGGTATDVTGTSPYTSGTVVDITAVAASCYRFVDWSASAGTFGDTNNGTTTFTMPAQDVTVTANFEAITLDHFKFYELDDEVMWPTIGEEVELEDQFRTITATVQQAVAFGNAADKVHDDVSTPMGDPDHYFTLYHLEYEELPGTWHVELKNQFGDSQQLTVSGPWWLAVPTQKEGHQAPECLDHFLVYVVDYYQPFEPLEVELNDQFTQETVTVLEPYMFANPVQKKVVGSTEVTEIQDPDDHLVFYWIEGEPYETSVQIHNQFGDQSFDLTNPGLLAVPSEKLDWGAQINHFKCYWLMESSPVGEIVGLKDQFVDISANVTSPFLFCNPAQKLFVPPTDPILDEDHHLTIYDLDDVTPQEWFVQVHNQFGAQDLTVYGPVALAVPTQKLSPYEHEPPVALEHYLLYGVSPSTALGITVYLKDEFEFEEYDEVMVMEPAYLAIPVQKTHGDTVTEIKNSIAHLVFYNMFFGAVYEPGVVVSSQFVTEQPLDLNSADMLAVPSLKLSYELAPE